MRNAIAILLVGCGAPSVDALTPGSCGLWDEAVAFEPPAGECSWVVALDGRGAVRSDDDCPNDSDDCVIALPGTPVVGWTEAIAGSSIQEFRFELEDGECPASCDWTGPCAPFHDVCIPCPPGVENAMTPEGEVACEGE